MPAQENRENRFTFLRRRPRPERADHSHASRRGWATFAIQAISALVATTAFGTFALVIRPQMLSEFQADVPSTESGESPRLPIHGMDLADDGRTMLLTSYQVGRGYLLRELHLDETEAKSELALLSRLDPPIMTARLCPSGDRIVVAQRDGTLSLFEKSSPQHARWRVAEELRREWATAIAISPDRTKVGTLWSDGRLQVNAMATGRQLWRIQLSEEQDGNRAFRFSRESDLLMAVSSSMTLSTFRAADGGMVMERHYRNVLVRGNREVRWNSNLQRLAQQRSLDLGDTTTAGMRDDLPRPDCVVVGDENELAAVDVRTGKIVYRVSSNDSRFLRGFISDDATLFVVTCVDGKFTLHDIVSKTRIGSADNGNTPTCQVQFSPDNSRMYMGTYRGNVVEWDLPNWRSQPVR